MSSERTYVKMTENERGKNLWVSRLKGRNLIGKINFSFTLSQLNDTPCFDCSEYHTTSSATDEKNVYFFKKNNITFPILIFLL